MTTQIKILRSLLDEKVKVQIKKEKNEHVSSLDNMQPLKATIVGLYVYSRTSLKATPN